MAPNSFITSHIFYHTEKHSPSLVRLAFYPFKAFYEKVELAIFQDAAFKLKLQLELNTTREEYVIHICSQYPILNFIYFSESEGEGF